MTTPFVNPYQPPLSDALAPNLQVGRDRAAPRSLRALSWFLVSGLAIQAVLNLSETYLHGALAGHAAAHTALAQHKLQLLSTLALAFKAAELGVFLLMLPGLGMFLHQALGNVKRFGHLQLETTARAMLGWWLVPVANLYKTYRGLEEVWRGSSPPQALPRQVWWRLVWGVFCVLQISALAASWLAYAEPSRGLVHWLAACAQLVDAGCCLGLAWWLVAVSRRQSRGAHSLLTRTARH